MLSSQSCDLFTIPFFQFAQMKKFCPEQIPHIKADYKSAWNNWKDLILQVSNRLGSPFAKPHIFHCIKVNQQTIGACVGAKSVYPKQVSSIAIVTASARIGHKRVMVGSGQQIKLLSDFTIVEPIRLFCQLTNSFRRGQRPFNRAFLVTSHEKNTKEEYRRRELTY